MKNSLFNRRKFIRDTTTAATGIAMLSALPKNIIAEKHAEPRIKFSVININHNHISSMVAAVIRGGGQLISVYAKEKDLLANFIKEFPQAKIATSENEILEDKSIQLVLSSGIPDERAPLGVEVMKHGKDYLVDKPGIITLEQLEEVRRVQKETKRIYSILYGERLENKASFRTDQLIKEGAIGNVIQTIGFGPHKMSPKNRPEWFFQRNRYGGILADIGSHQFDQFLFYTNSTSAEVVASQTGNVHHSQYPELEDFGDVMLRGNNGVGYIRVDWFTPDGLASWGDGRLTILGTEGFIEVRKNIDIAGPAGGSHVYLVNQKETKMIDCINDPLPFGELFVNDIINRTETAMAQEHCFLATELALKAQKMAQKLNLVK